MIKNLTKDQKSKFQEYVDKWLKIGLSTERINRPDAIKRWHEFDRLILGNNNKVPVIFMDSPLSAWLATVYLFVLFYGDSQVRNQVGNRVWSQVGNRVWSQVRSQVESQVENQVWNQVWNQVGSQVWNQVDNQMESQVRNQVGNQVRNQVESQVENQVRNQVGDQVESQVWNQVRSQVWNQARNRVWSQVRSQVESQVRNQVESQVENQVGSQVWNQVENQVENFVYPYLNNTHWAGYYSFYDFMNIELGIVFDKKKEWEMLRELKDLSWVYPFKDFCVISEKPTEINMKNGLLHKEGGPSVKYADGFSVWSLNGVRVSQYLAETPGEKLDIEFFKKESNADVKAEFIRKYGIERMAHLGKTIDKVKVTDDELWKMSEYELIDMASIFDSIDYAPFLKMKNLTTGIYHLEGVSPECRTVEQAINFRWNGRKNFKIETIK